MHSTMQRKPKKAMNVKQRFSCGVGGVFNDVFRQLCMTFEISFLMKVIELSPSQAGLVFLVSQLTDAFISPVNGYFGDRVPIPFVSKRMGHRKSWHLVGTILLAVAAPLLFNRCLLCEEFDEISWLPVAYFGFVEAVVNIGYSMMEINHLSIISTVTETIREATALNTMRLVSSSSFHNFIDDGVGLKRVFIFATQQEFERTLGKNN